MTKRLQPVELRLLPATVGLVFWLNGLLDAIGSGKGELLPVLWVWLGESAPSEVMIEPEVKL